MSLEKSDARDLPRSPVAAAIARQHVWRFCSGLPRDLVEVATLLTSELVTNAVRHARGSIRLAMNRDRAMLHIEVSDDSPDPPVVRNAHPTDTGGRGVMLVDRLAAGWGVAMRNGGKVVWFRLPTPRHEPERSQQAPVRYGSVGPDATGD